MVASVEKMHRNDHSIGENHVPADPMFQMKYNIANMKMGRMELGHKKWWQRMSDVVSELDYPELEQVFKGRRLPSFVAERLNSEHQQWITSGQKYPDRKRIGKAPRFNRRIRRALAVFSKAPLGNIGFLTIVTSFKGTEAEAIAAAEADAVRLGAFIRRRFRHAVSLLFPEVDLKVASDVQSGLLPLVGWKLEYDPRQRIFKIHFHGLIYVPDHTPADIEAAFKINKNGKRNKFYSGSNQVRVIPVKEAPGFDDGTADVEGVAGYATKYIYNPPVKARMLEGFVSWLVVAHALLNNPKSIVVVGVQSGIKVRCDDCETYHGIDDGCMCEPIIQRDNSFYDVDLCDGVETAPFASAIDEGLSITLSDEQPYAFPSTQDISLNSSAPSAWNVLRNRAKKKLFSVFVYVGSLIGWWLISWAKPQGP